MTSARGCWHENATSGTSCNHRLEENGDFDSGFSDLKRVIGGKDLPEEVKSQLVALHEEAGTLKEQFKESQDKLSKAKAVCMNRIRNLRVSG